jgi:hypothetical protein
MDDFKFNLLFSCSIGLAVLAAIEFSEWKPSSGVVMLIIVFVIFFIVPQTIVAMLDTVAESFTESDGVFGKNVWFFSKVISVIISAVIIVGGIIGLINLLAHQ